MTTDGRRLLSSTSRGRQTPLTPFIMSNSIMSNLIPTTIIGIIIIIITTIIITSLHPLWNYIVLTVHHLPFHLHRLLFLFTVGVTIRRLLHLHRPPSILCRFLPSTTRTLMKKKRMTTTKMKKTTTTDAATQPRDALLPISNINATMSAIGIATRRRPLAASVKLRVSHCYIYRQVNRPEEEEVILS